MTAKAIGKSAPAPSPWTPRAATSCHISCDSPASSEPTMKMPIPNRNTGRRPNRSESLPYNGPLIVDVSRYAVNAHV